MEPKGKKICVIVTSLGRGGAERSSSMLTRMLGSAGHEVHLVSVMDIIDYAYDGNLLNLGAMHQSGSKLINKFKKYRTLKRFLRTQNFDLVVDNRSRPAFLRELIMARWVHDPSKTIYAVRSFNLSLYFIKPNWLAKYIYKDAKKIVAVSKQIAEQIRTSYGLANVTTIYNPIESITTEAFVHSRPYILFFGRMEDDVKNLSLLLNAYGNSDLPQKQIDLLLLGDGKDVQKFKEKVAMLNLNDNVKFLPYQSHPFSYVKGALFTLLTSHYEGFPRSVIESLSVETPVISVDCDSGPREIITNEVNGLLVENYNIQALADAMNRMIDDSNLYATCKSNAQQSVDGFSMKSIMREWSELLN
ncbi:MAG: glycosyltransferase [Psychroserpens sp.]|nr:glycosyltransferase [Psychroserpens sp.]MBO6941195.1 glycosyltransferase [Psychroserpens sp.]